MRSHLLPREKHCNLREKIDGIGPFQIVTQEDFSSGIVNNTNSECEKLSWELGLSSMWIGHAAQSVNNFEWLLHITTWWQQEDVKYVKILKYVNNKKFVCTIKELQGLVVSRLMELDKMNLAGSGMQLGSL